MFDWLFEGRLAVYLFLGVVASIFVAMYWRTRKRYWFIPVGVMVLLLAAYFLLDRVVETRTEQITRKLREMAAAVQRRDAATIFRHISDDFRMGGRDKAGFRTFVEAEFNRVTRLTVWEFQFPDDTGRVSFFAKPEAPALGANTHYLVRAEFVLEGSEWRLRTFQIFNPFANTNTPLDIPAPR